MSRRRHDASLAAFAGIHPDKHAIKADIHLYLLEQGMFGATCEDIEFALRLRHQTCSPRITELVNEGKLIDSGQRRYNVSGRTATVWIAVRPEDFVQPRAIVSRPQEGTVT